MNENKGEELERQLDRGSDKENETDTFFELLL